LHSFDEGALQPASTAIVAAIREEFTSCRIATKLAAVGQVSYFPVWMSWTADVSTIEISIRLRLARSRMCRNNERDEKHRVELHIELLFNLLMRRGATYKV
jgi:hypothetical protein